MSPVMLSGPSVGIACAAIATRLSRQRRNAKSREHSTAAAAPQVGGQAIRRVIPPSRSTSSAITFSRASTVRSTALGLRAAWRLDFVRMLAKVFSRVPWQRMCSRPAPLK